MVSKAKLYSKLDILEDQLKELLIPHLESASTGENDLIFCVKQFNPPNSLKYKTDKLTEELIEIGSQVLSLREKLTEPSKGTVAERICWYCKQWRDIESHHKSSTRELATQFLNEIKNTLT